MNHPVILGHCIRVGKYYPHFAHEKLTERLNDWFRVTKLEGVSVVCVLTFTYCCTLRF